MDSYHENTTSRIRMSTAISISRYKLEKQWIVVQEMPSLPITMGIAQFMWPRKSTHFARLNSSSCMFHARATHVVLNTRSSGLDTFGALSAY